MPRQTRAAIERKQAKRRARIIAFKGRGPGSPSYAAVGREFGITKMRAWQICHPRITPPA